MKLEKINGGKELGTKPKPIDYSSVSSNIEAIQEGNYDNQILELKEGLEKQDNFSGKTIICFVGAPGAGKTTQKKLLQDQVNPDTFHMSGYVKSLGKKKDVEEKKLKGELIEGYENEFLNSVGDSTNAFCILDGFPRSEEQVILLYRKALELGWNIKIICLEFKECEVTQKSLDRQNSRSIKEGKNETDERRSGKLKRYFGKDKKAISLLIKLSKEKFYRIDAEENINYINNIINEALCIKELQGKFDLGVLKDVFEVQKDTGIELWLGAGLIYRNYFNGIYGPIRDSFDKDIHISHNNDVEQVLQKLETNNDKLRWSVDSRLEDTEVLYGIKSISLKEAITTFPLTFRQVGIRLNKNGDFSIKMTSKAQHDLENGIIRIDEDLLKKVPNYKKQSFLDRSVTRAHKILQEYPLLKLKGIIKKLYYNKYGIDDKKILSTNPIDILKSIPDLEFGGKQIWRDYTINQEQLLLMGKIVKFYRKTEVKLNIVKYPEKGILPSPLNYLMELKQKLERGDILTTNENILLSSDYLPEGYKSQLDYISRLKDMEFNEWFFNQVRSRKPLGGKDPFIEKCIAYMTVNQKKEQKPTHIGLPLHIHSIDVIGQLKTDDLIKKLSEIGYDKEVITSIRRCMRIGMFLHDIGKTKNSMTPGCHELVGAKIWLKIVPEWINDNEKKIISWIISIHDVFGRLARSITEKEGININNEKFDVLSFPSYKGAIDPKEASNIIKKSPLNNYIAFEIVKEIWLADIASVSSLSWILGISNILFKLVEIEIGKSLE